MVTTAIIRNRGQLTIPDKIRSSLGWTETNSVVSITVSPAREIVIKQYSQKANNTDWNKLMKDLERVRSYSNTNTESMSEFIAKDRYAH